MKCTYGGKKVTGILVYSGIADKEEKIIGPNWFKIFLGEKMYGRPLWPPIKCRILIFYNFASPSVPYVQITNIWHIIMINMAIWS